MQILYIFTLPYFSNTSSHSLLETTLLAYPLNACMRSAIIPQRVMPFEVWAKNASSMLVSIVTLHLSVTLVKDKMLLIDFSPSMWSPLMPEIFHRKSLQNYPSTLEWTHWSPFAMKVLSAQSFSLKRVTWDELSNKMTSPIWWLTFILGCFVVLCAPESFASEILEFSFDVCSWLDAFPFGLKWTPHQPNVCALECATIAVLVSSGVSSSEVSLSEASLCRASTVSGFFFGLFLLIYHSSCGILYFSRQSVFYVRVLHMPST